MLPLILAALVTAGVIILYRVHKLRVAYGVGDASSSTHSGLRS